jgi:hypothetical protein
MLIIWPVHRRMYSWLDRCSSLIVVQGVATGVPTIFFSVGDNSKDGLFGFLDLANNLNAQTSPPHVFTTSYGANEPGISTTLYK